MEGASNGEIFLKLTILLVCYPLGLVVSVFVHELGHSMAALAVTKQPIHLAIGKGELLERISIGRLSVHASWRGMQFGSTRYDRSLESRNTQLLIALGGPLLTVLLAVSLGWFLKDIPLGGWQGLSSLALFVANFRILIVSLWPMEYRPNSDGEEIWLSDALDIWRLLRRK
ncbi:hypothetical protein MLD52_17105 [Puniceicoccaceae bacterium K14]|nr:hypothetical protein [Puniceicoccaceae bacterium K14]